MSRSPMRLVRSVLFCPADRPRVLRKAVTQVCPDVVLMDMEDAVSPKNKEQARDNLVEVLKELKVAASGGDTNGISAPDSVLSTAHKRTPQLAVRINCPLTSQWGLADLNALQGLHFDTLVLPKVEDMRKVDELVAAAGLPASLSKWAMIESARGVANVQSTAQYTGVEALVVGSNDLTKDLKARPQGETATDRQHLMYSLSKCVLHARAAGKLVLDSVFMNLHDEKGLLLECKQARMLGFDGKTLIHPKQVDAANAAFSPSEDELSHAHKVIQAYNAAIEQGQSLAVVDGQLIELLHVEQAREMLLLYAAAHESSTI